MTYSFRIMAGRIGCAGLLGAACLAGAAAAQQPAPRKAPAAQADQQAEIAPIGWAKLCRNYTASTKDKDGKVESQDLSFCLTKNETIYRNSGKMRSSAAIRQVAGDPKQYLMVTVPLEMNLRSGLRATVFPKDIWEKSQKGGQISKADEAKLKPLPLVYTQCTPAGCDGELEATPQLIEELMTGGGLVVLAFNPDGAPVAFPVPLAGFEKAYKEAAMTELSYNNARRRLMLQIEQQQELKGTIVLPKQLPR
jgi:invasion protein IalB